MTSRSAEIRIRRSPGDVWAIAGDFAGLADWMPGIESCRVEGDTRVVGTFGIEIVERLVERDDATRTLRYTIAESPLALEEHAVTITVHDADDGGSRVTWDVTVLPDEHVAMFADIYRQSLDALRAHLEAAPTSS